MNGHNFTLGEEDLSLWSLRTKKEKAIENLKHVTKEKESNKIKLAFWKDETVQTAKKSHQLLDQINLLSDPALGRSSCGEVNAWKDRKEQEFKRNEESYKQKREMVFNLMEKSYHWDFEIGRYSSEISDLDRQIEKKLTEINKVPAAPSTVTALKSEEE